MYPRVNINLNKLRENAQMLCEYLNSKEIELVAVTKVFGADAKIIEAYYEGGIRHFADARLLNLARIDPKYGKRTLLRIPMLSELNEVITYSDCSLQSEWKTLEALDEVAGKQGKKHEILLMIDLGDLREGIFSEEELFNTAERIVKLQNVDWIGTGTNLTCYGGIIPSKENLSQLVTLTRKLRETFQIELPVISGGNSSSLCLTDQIQKPGWNQLRIGEALAVGTEAAYGQRFLGLHTDAFHLEAQIVEYKRKPSMPVGEVGKNAFGESPVFKNRGERHRAIVAIGRQDAEADDLQVGLDGAQILGASSDHMILDVENCDPNRIRVGDTLSFGMNYRAVLRAFTSVYVDRNYQ